MVAKLDKSSSGGEMAEVDDGSNNQSRRRKSFNNKPSWLLCTIADLDDRLKKLMKRQHKESGADGFAARANSYYHERPQLLELLEDLYNAYLSLADRYCQSLTKNQKQTSRCSSPIPPPRFDEATETDGDNNNGEVVDSDAESSLSYQAPSTKTKAKTIDADIILAELIIKTVEYEIVIDEVEVAEKRFSESCRKMDLQRNLLDVLESERLILLNDNATLGYRVTALAEENKGLVSETQFMKRKAAELARCVLKTREDHRVCMLSQKIEDLQGQIYRLEKRNKEYYDQLVKQNEKGDGGKDLKKVKGGKEVSLEDCLHGGSGGGGGAVLPGLGKCFSFNLKSFGDQNGKVENGRASKLWDKVKKLELFNCGPNF